MAKQIPEELKKAVDVLLNKVPTKDASFATQTTSKRVKIFKGKKLVKMLLNPDVRGKVLATNAPMNGLEDRDEAEKFAEKLLQCGHFFVKVEKFKERPGYVMLPGKGANNGLFDYDGKYMWIYEGDQTTRNILLGCLITVFLACCMFPIWPRVAKIGIWYISVTLLLIILGFIFIRLIVAAITWMCGYELWILPNVFDEELPFFDSFKPVYSLDPTEGSQRKYRAGLLVLLLAMGYWIATTPTDYDKYVKVQYDLIQDLYSGKLLDTKSQTEKDNIDKVIPSVDDLMKEDADLENLSEEEATAKRLEDMLNEDYAEDDMDAKDAAMDAAADAADTAEEQ